MNRKPRFETDGVAKVSKSAASVKSLLLKSFGVIGLAAVFSYSAPVLWNLLETRVVWDLENRLRTTSGEQAYLILDKISEMGPRGTPALARALSHPDDAVFFHAYQILWRKIRSWDQQLVDPQEVLWTVKELSLVFPRLAPSRQQCLAELANEFLQQHHEHGRHTARIVKLCEGMLSTKVDRSQFQNQVPSGCNLASSSQSDDTVGSVVRFQSVTAPERAAKRSDIASKDAATVLPEELDSRTVNEISRKHTAPSTSMGDWELPADELTAWKQVFAGPGAQLTIYEEEAKSSATISRSFGPASIVSYVAPAGEETNSWKPVDADAIQSQDQHVNGLAPQTEPRTGQSVSPDAAAPEDTSPSPSTHKPITWTTLEPLFAQLSGEPAQAEQAYLMLKGFGLNAAAIEAGRMAYHPDSTYRRRAISSIWNLAGVDPIPFLFRLARDSDVTVRHEALAILATMNNPEVRAFVRDTVSQDSDPGIQLLRDEIGSKDINNIRAPAFQK